MYDSLGLARSLAVEIKHLSSLRPLSAEDQALIQTNAERIAEILAEGRARTRPTGGGLGHALLALLGLRRTRPTVIR